MLVGCFHGNNLTSSSSAVWKCNISHCTEIITLGIEGVSFFRHCLNVYLSSAFPKIAQHTASSLAAWASLSSVHLFNSLAELMFFVHLSPSLSPSTQRAPCLWRPTWEALNAALHLSLALWCLSEKDSRRPCRNITCHGPLEFYASHWAVATENEETQLPWLLNVPFMTFCLVVILIHWGFFL